MTKKIIFITGSEGQLGKKMVTIFSSKNWECYGIDIYEEPASYLNLKGYLKGDVTKRLSFKNLFKMANVKNNFQYKIALINNAGVAVFTPSEERTYEEFRKVSDINLFGPINGITEFFKYFIKEKTNLQRESLHIINIASIYGLISPNENIYTDTKRNSSEIYGASKAGLIQLTKYFATRYAKHNIQVNAIAPGGVLNENHQGVEFIKKYSNLVPQNRLCNDYEVANLIYSIIESNCSYLSGQTIALDGGMSSW